MSLSAPVRDEMVERLWLATKHGDDDHQTWLHDAYVAFFAGEPVPPPRGRGNKEARIAELEEQVATLTASQVEAGEVEPTIAEGPSAAEMDIALSEAGFVHGAQSCREMMARFVETSPPTDLKVLAGSIRANWHPGWGADPGPITGPIPDNPLGDLALHIELLDIDREAALARKEQP